MTTFTHPLTARSTSLATLWPYLIAGTVFGVALVKSEAASWYRIQEMFRFQNFHMFGIIGSAIVTAMIGVAFLRRLTGVSLEGAPIEITPKDPGLVRYVYGGVLFGLGWGLVGVCPGPIFTLLGAGSVGMLVVLPSALLGVWLYALLRDKLPH